MGCRLPGGVVGTRSFWQLLESGQDGVVEVPPDRWHPARFHDPDGSTAGRTACVQGGFLQQPLAEFDWQFFGISPREAAQLDPQQRLLLEIAWEALEDAGLPPHLLRGSLTGVYVGGFILDHLITGMGPMNRRLINSHSGLGATLAMLSNRVSYTFDFRGPSLSVDTACSGSLSAIHLACQSLQTGDCDLALAGGVNIMYRPEPFVALSKGGYLAPDGHCKTFDARADGYGRGEGAGLLVLKRLSEAQEDGDRIHSLILATGANQDGKTSGITLPNPQSQINLLRRILSKARVTPALIDYVEAHGTGTQAGDQAEVHSLHQVLSEGRSPESKIWLGAVKANIGHLEAAAGVASLIKTTLVLKHRRVPPNLKMEQPNPALGLGDTVLEPPTRVEKLDSEKTLHACVDAFGYGGSNAAAVLQSYPDHPAPPSPGRARWLIPISAASQESLRRRAGGLAQYLGENPECDLGHLGHTLSVRRSHLEHRALFCCEDPSQLRACLEDYAEGREASSLLGEGSSPVPRKVLFLYTGMGAQSAGMGEELRRREPLFEESFQECDALWQKLSGESLVCKLEAGSPMVDPIDAQPANLFLQVGLTRLLRHYGVEADAVTGHSVGEVAAAWAAGVLTLEEAVKLCYHRCRLQQRQAGCGTMLAVGLSAEAVRPRLSEWGVELAAVNGPNAVVLAGSEPALAAVADELSGRRVFAGMVKVSVPYHSSSMDSLEKEFKAQLVGLTPKCPRLPLFSTVTGTEISTDCQDVNYWWRNARDPVNLHGAVAAAGEQGFDTLLEVGPHPVLGNALLNMVRQTSHCLRRGESEPRTLLEGVGRLYAGGAELNWHSLYPSGQLLSLPTYPWSREHLWIETPESEAYRLGSPAHPLLGYRKGGTSPGWESELNLSWLPYLSDHKLENQVIFPGAGYVEMALAAGRELLGDEGTLVVEQLEFLRPLSPRFTPIVQFQTEGPSFSINSRPTLQSDAWAENVRGRISAGAYRRPGELRAPENGQAVGKAEFYTRLKARGFDYGTHFQTVSKVWRHRDEIWAELELGDELEAQEYLAHPCLLDGAFQSLLIALDTEVFYIPAGTERVRCFEPLGSKVLLRARLTRTAGEGVCADLELADESGQVQVEFLKLRFQPLPRLARGKASPVTAYAGLWQPQPRSPETGAPLRWRVQASAFKAELERGLEEPGQSSAGADEEAEALLCLFLETDEIGLDACEQIRRRVETADRLKMIAVVTDRAHQVTGYDPVAHPGRGSVWGFVRVLAREFPSLAVRLIDLDTTRDWVEELCRELAGKERPLEVALRGETRFLHRLDTWKGPGLVPSQPGQPYQLRILNPGSFDSVCFCELERRAPGPGELEIAIHASALNFKDILKALGLLPTSYVIEASTGGDLGMECAGVVSAVGPEVDFKVGDEVIAFCRGALASHVVTRGALTFAQPVGPTDSVQHLNFMTAYRGLVELADLSAGETVLIHSGAGGVGLAAIEIAKNLGAKVVTTAGSPEKRDYLRKLGVELVCDSRTLAFYDEIMEHTGGRGVEVVLNSVAGDAMRASFQLLTHDGRFVEIGKRDITDHQKLDLALFDRNQSYSAMDIDILVMDQPERFYGLMARVNQMLREGALTPLPTRVFPARECVDALRFMARSRHIGKVTVDFKDQSVPVRSSPMPLRVDPEATYLVTGGFRGLGLEICRWLLERGARNLVVLSRSGPSQPAALEFVEEFESRGGRLQAPRVDISDPDAVARALEGVSNLKGVIHCAAVLHDGPLRTMESEALSEVMRVKAGGAWTLHRQTLDRDLDFFVMFSSATSLLGSPGQANYAAANAFLDSLAHHRRALGLPALAINWGAMGEVGMVARSPKAKQHLEGLGFKLIALDQALAAMEWALGQNCGQVGLIELDWSRWGERHHEDSATSPFSALMGAGTSRNGKSETRAQLMASEGPERKALVVDFLLSLLSRSLHLPLDRLNAEMTMARVGVDSLIAVELANAVRLETGVDLGALSFSTASIGELADEICDRLEPQEDKLLEQIDEMNEEELDKLLSEIG